MPNPSDLQLTLIADYLAGAMPAGQREKFEREIAESPALAEMVSRLSTSQKSLGSHIPVNFSGYENRVDAISVRIRARISSQQGEAALSTAGALRSRVSSSPLRYLQTRSIQVVAAMAVAAVVVTGVWKMPGTWMESSSGNNVSGPLGSSVAVSTYTTSNGERATITLPDGSTALLNVGSTIKVPVDYSAGNRTLQLTGEALFTVSHKTHSPFTVVAGPGSARVLGTRFLVRHYPGDSIATVAVQDGRVAVDTVVLGASQQAGMNWDGEISTSPADPSQFSFVAGFLTFNRQSLGEAIAQLNRWYDAEIRLADISLKDRRITGEFNSGSVVDLANILRETFSDVGVVQDGKVITLYPR